jgi:hypothetical protein
METNPNINRLLEMLDNPEAYSEQEIRGIINSDDETRRAYQLMVAAKQAYSHKQPEKSTDVQAAWQRFESKKLKVKKDKSASVSIFYKIAASLIGILMLSGITLAAFRIFSPTEEQQPTEMPAPTYQSSTLNVSGPIRFSDVRLDSILTVVSSHYGKAVCFLDTTAQELRLSTMWNCEDSLSVFIATLNEFDGLLLKEEGDTVFVGTEIEEAE